MGRRLLVALVALLLAGQVIRTAAAAAFADSSPAAAQRVWPDHPDVEIAAAMTAIATATREGRKVADSTFAQILDSARKAPLAPEPFLVRGVQAQLAGDDRLAEDAFVAARWRDGRSLPARYFLASHYLKTGDARSGLTEVAALARLAPNGTASVAPYVAAYAGNRSAWPQLRKLFRAEPTLEDATLGALSRNAANADLVLALATPGRLGPKSAWLPGLIQSLIDAKRYAKAREAWAAVARVRLDRGQTLYDPQFTEKVAPPPFNWDLTSSTVGLAERRDGGGLHLIYYGQEDGSLASQLLVLPAGQYRMAMRGNGRPVRPEALQWTLACASSGATIASIPLDQALRGEWRFAVPADCPAQWLRLAGSSGDVPQQSEATIGAVSLLAEGPND
jgi:hypothetical protein